METIESIPMTAVEFLDYSENSIANYAEDSIQAGIWTSTDALANARTAFRDLLPAGLQTRENFICSIKKRSTKETVGSIWFKIRRGGNSPTTHILDLIILRGFRKRGYARQALNAIERVAADNGATAMTLHVFAHNEIAQHLYRATGYEVSGYLMRKRIDLTS
jgi:ribosomal protein S18 acetylase RimI-like enzyme